MEDKIFNEYCSVRPENRQDFGASHLYMENTFFLANSIVDIFLADN